MDAVALLKPEQVARQLGISKPQVYRLLATGEIAGGMRVGDRAIRIDPVKYERWLAERKKQGMRPD